MICKYTTQFFDEGALLSRLLHGLTPKQTRFALALKIALLGGAVAFSSVAIADEIFATLMGEDVEARRNFIQQNAKDVRFLDI